VITLTAFFYDKIRRYFQLKKVIPMPWIQVKLNATSENAEQISDMLMEETGALSVTFLDAKDVPIFEPLPGETRLWGETDIVALYDAETNMDLVIAQLKASSVLDENFAYKVEQLEDKDWEREWMDNFHPMKFGERLWICPSWREIPDPDAINVMLDPGLAFGTGTHATTALCLEWLESIDLEGKTVIDFGCGSGILAIAAIKLGAAKVVGIDIDPQAITASKDNAARNGVADQLELFLPQDQPENLVADVVVANILAAPLRELSSIITAHVAPGGALAMSGVLDIQALDVASYYSDNFTLDAIAEQQEWCRISGMKK
jgi:ribosomal protein L11 methyltransferase